MNLFFYLLSSILCAAGTAIVLVEKRFDWPVRGINVRLRWALRRLVHRKMQRMLRCSVCTSFWAALLADVAVCLWAKGGYWLWPLSGFAASGLVWALYEILKVLTPAAGREGDEAAGTPPPVDYEEPAEVWLPIGGGGSWLPVGEGYIGIAEEQAEETPVAAE
jgi:hypothetical protein